MRPNDQASLIRAIELNSLLWGGTYNPIIPAYKVLPKKWIKDHDIFQNSAKEILKGYVDAYDPDFLIPLGECKKEDHQWLGREILADTSIDQKTAQVGDVSYGVSLFEVLHGFLDKELKYVRKQPIDFRILRLKANDRFFLGSVFGALPEKVDSQFKKYWAKPLDAKLVDVDIGNYAEQLRGNFLRRLLNYTIEQNGNFGWNRGQGIFILDAKNVSDVIDFWNLRALGWRLLPVAIQSVDSDSLKNIAAEFIEQNSGVSRHNKDIYYHCSVLATKNVDKEKVKDFCESLKIKEDPASRGSRFMFAHYPRIWDEWARDKDGAICCELDAGSASHDFTGSDGDVRVDTVDPEFAARFTEGEGPRYANDVATSNYFNDDLYAEVIPEGKKHLSRALSPMSLNEWRFSRRAASYLTEHKNWHIYVKTPKAEEVFQAWMEDNGLKVKLSAPGRMAKQIVKLLGGKYGINTLANEHFIALLKKMESGNEIHPEEFWMRKEEFWAELCKIAETKTYKHEPAELLESYIEKKIFQLGVRVKCDTCSRQSWFDIDSLGYTVQCKHCFEKFDIPSHSPDDLVWCYRTIGPFNLPKRADGVLPSLLTLRIFTNLMHHELTTPMLSFETSIDGKPIEVDLGLFYRERRYNSDEDAKLIFAECKGENSFKREDVDRMRLLADKFPGAVLVFSTLKEDLTDQEIKLLKPLVNRCRRYYKAEEPYNPVMILTKTELFANYGLTYAWKDKGGKYVKFGDHFYYGDKLLGLCDATQQIYLGMKPWQEWVSEQFKKRAERRKDKKTV